MTEANIVTFIPQLIHLSAQQDFKAVVLTAIQNQYGSISPEQLNWINEENGTLTIEMVRNVSLHLSFAPLGGKVRHIVLVSIDQATIEAQNALLKLLEEPPAATQIWLTATHAQRVLPTILSRVQEIPQTQNTYTVSEATANLAKKISTLSHRELSDLASSYTEREDAKKLLAELSLYFHTQLKESAHPALVATIQKLLQTEQYLDANVNVRLALESCFFALKKYLS